MKPLEEMTFDELVRYQQGRIVLAIPVGKFNETVWMAMDSVFLWQKAQKDQEEKK